MHMHNNKQLSMHMHVAASLLDAVCFALAFGIYYANVIVRRTRFTRTILSESISYTVN